jgi:hypothetical protein
VEGPRPPVVVEHRDAGEVRRQQIRGALHPTEGPADGAGQGLGQHGLAHARDVLEQHVAAGQERGHGQADGRLLADDHRRGGGDQRGPGVTGGGT